MCRQLIITPGGKSFDAGISGLHPGNYQRVKLER